MGRPLAIRREIRIVSMGVLALNASFEPLTIVPARRAVRLVLDQKAEILEADHGRAFRSERVEVPLPLVIRLVRFVHVPRRFRRQVTNTFLFARDNYSCQYCGRHRSELRGRQFLTRDHILPLSRGGGNTWDNVVTSCSAVGSVTSGSVADGLRMSWSPVFPASTCGPAGSTSSAGLPSSPGWESEVE